MGDMFTSSNAIQSTRNQQAGVQLGDGSQANVNTGRVDGGAYATNYVAPAKIKKGGNQIINLQSTDMGAVAGGINLGMAALQATQNLQNRVADSQDAAIHFAEQASNNQAAVTMGALQSNTIVAAHALDINGQMTQALLETNSEAFNVAVHAISGAASEVIELAHEAVLKATPLDAGDLAATQTGQNKSQMIIALVGAAAIVVAAIVANR